jgi:hypothetical protein
MATRLNRVALDHSLNLLVAGIEKHLAGASLVVATTTYSSATLVTSFQSLTTAIQATATAKAAYQAAVKEEDALFAKIMPLVSGVRALVYQMYAGAIDTLADFGLTPHKKAVVTPEERAASIAKAKATRAARHTMGKNQKKAITGSVPTQASPVSPASSVSPVVSAGTNNAAKAS